MSSTVMNLEPRRGVRWRTLVVALGWVVVAALIARFYGRVVLNYIHFNAAHYHHYWIAKWWMVAHIGGGTLALLLGPFQFSGWLRRRYVKAHRWMGRLYLVGVAVGTVGAVYMGLWVSEIRGFGVALLYLALAWVVTSGMGYISAVRRQFAAHREWMIRSYVVTFAFVLFRLLSDDLNVFASLSLEAQLVMQVWVAWAVPLLLTEVVLQWRRSMGLRRG